MENFHLPAAFEEYSDARKAGFLKVKAAKESGKKVAGCFCAFTPLEILDAADMLTVSLCGMSPENIPAAETAGPISKGDGGAAGLPYLSDRRRFHSRCLQSTGRALYGAGARLCYR